MVLDTIHFEAMADLIARINRPGRTRDRRAIAERIWQEALAEPPARFPVTPIGPAERHVRSIDEVATEDTSIEIVTAVDAGTLNPMTFQNGLVVDIAHAAAASTPSDVDRHRRRTIVATVHGPPAEVRSVPDWTSFDAEYGRARLVAAPAVEGEIDTAVHGLALATAEVRHALDFGIEGSDLLFMDGSVYPAGVLHWIDRGGELEASLYTDPEPRAVLQDAVDLVDRCRERSIPLVGVVKNWTARGIVRAINGAEEIEVGTVPWPTDASLFQQLLAIVSDDHRELRWTNWFTVEGHVATGLGYAIEEYGLDAAAPAAAYDLATMIVYDPRENLVLRVEAPRDLIDDEGVRDRVTTHVLAGIAREGGPPPTLRKADELARIGRGERKQLTTALQSVVASTEVANYDDRRWGGG